MLQGAVGACEARPVCSRSTWQVGFKQQLFAVGFRRGRLGPGAYDMQPARLPVPPIRGNLPPGLLSRAWHMVPVPTCQAHTVTLHCTGQEGREASINGIPCTMYVARDIM
jgi:hypothetical protein